MNKGGLAANTAQALRDELEKKKEEIEILKERLDQLNKRDVVISADNERLYERVRELNDRLRNYC
jgi:predicted nuclease with TOPRIM domain